MKYLFILTIMASFMATAAFATEVETDCPMMREDTSRNNPKLSLDTTKVKTKTRSKGSSAQ